MLLTVVIPIGNLDRDHENLKSIIKSLRNIEIEIVFVLDTEEKSAVLFLSELCKFESLKNYKVLECTDRNPGTSRNVGITAAEGEWIVFCDSDDMPIFSNLQTAMSKANSECDIVIGSFETEDPSRVITPVRLIVDDPKFNWESISLNPGVWRWLIKRKLLEHITFPELSIGEDQFFLIKLLSVEPTITFSSESFYVYRTGRQGRLTSNKAKINDLLKNIEAEIVYVKSLGTRSNVINNMIFKQLITLFKKGTFDLKLKSLFLFFKFTFSLSFVENFSMLKFTSLILKSK
jgi:glycosyltransferase involved in cell wall biosynthesis